MITNAQPAPSPLIDAIPIIIGGAPIVYRGSPSPRATIDFHGFIPEPLWDNEDRDDRKFPALQKAFCSYEEVIDLFNYHKLTASSIPKMPLSTFRALSEIADCYHSGPKSVTGYKLHFDVSVFRNGYRHQTHRQILLGIINTIILECTGHTPNLGFEIIKIDAA